MRKPGQGWSQARLRIFQKINEWLGPERSTITNVFSENNLFYFAWVILRVIYYVCMCACVCLCLCVCSCIYIYIHGCENVFMYEVYMYVCMHVCVMWHQVCGQRVVMAKS